jgi:hypothetical protein
MSASRVYILPISSLASLTTTSFWQLAPPSTIAIEIMCIRLGQEASETSEQLAMSITRRSTASTLPTSTTPIAVNQRDPTSLLTGSTTTNATGIATVAGTLVSTPEPGICFNALTGLLWLPPESMRITVQPSSFLTGQFLAAPAAGTWSGSIYFRELF